MEGNDCLRNFSDNLFWDVDLSTLDLDKYPAYVIPRVLEHGTLSDWKFIKHYYGMDKIVEVCKNVRSLDPICLSFICLISNTNKEDYRCYHFRQSFPTPWNS